MFGLFIQQGYCTMWTIRTYFQVPGASWADLLGGGGGSPQNPPNPPNLSNPPNKVFNPPKFPFTPPILCERI